MKIIHVLALAASVWLAGCAGLQSTTPGDEAPGPVKTGDLATVPTAELHSRGVAQLAAPTDIWERIRRDFAIPDLDNDTVHQYEQWYIDHPDYLARMTERSRLYLFHIVEELELRGMPSELALLPYIESAFNPQALSSAKAAGLWQFIPSTGTSYDLRQNALRDDRRNVLASTRAALDFLQELHDQFGDWQLALAAYNWGPGNVQRAIAKNEAAGRGTRYVDLDMPAETRNYVPKLQAVKNIVAEPRLFGAVLPEIGNHPFFDTVTITRDIDVARAAQFAGVSIEDFKALNPSQRKPIIFAAGTPQILLPWNNATAFKVNLARADPTTLASWNAWVAPRTMTVAEAAQAVDMDGAELQQLNGIPQRVRIKQGSTLLVPRQNGAPAAADAHVVNNAQIAYAPEVTLQRTVLRARPGDTIASIAGRYDLPAATVARWNRAHPGTRLARGHHVVLYLPPGTRASVAAAAPSSRVVSKRRITAQAATRHAPAKRSARARHATPARASAKAGPTRPTGVAKGKTRPGNTVNSGVVLTSKRGK